MRSALLALLLMLPTAHAQDAASVVGDWSGEIEGAGVVVVVHVTETDGDLAAALDVPAQGAQGIAASGVSLEGDTLRITWAAINATFRGAVEGETLAGTWEQNGFSLPLALARLNDATAADLAPDRPQTPRAPFPYAEEPLRIETPDGVTLVGTLTVPEGDGPFPTVVLVSGSGPQDRDSEILGHRPFAVWADHLARQGVAVFRYDERGVGASSGDFGSATTATFAADAQAVAEHLATWPHAGPVGVMGHSEGGAVAPIAANASEAVDFVVLLAPPAVPGADILAFQFTRDLEGAGVDPAIVSRLRASVRANLMETDAAEPDSVAAGRLSDAYWLGLQDITPAQRERLGLTEGAARSVGQVLLSPWMRYFVRYDPSPALQGLEVPALAVFGSVDQQVRASDNVPAAEAALAGNPRAAVVVMDGLNHLLQPSATGAPAEYGAIATTVDPAVLERVTAWILETGRTLTGD